MMTLLAASEWSAPTGIAAWLACAAFVLMLVNGAFKLNSNIKGPPSHPPAGELDLRVAHLEERVTQFESTLTELRSEMREDLQTILSAGEERAGKIHGRINDVLAAVSELRGRVTK